ncbi:hypothetical protein G6F68_014827 [Rhizopus microsporus]|nr:hypothetical protein G6F68_014827 [Rhizopus microsporus]
MRRRCIQRGGHQDLAPPEDDAAFARIESHVDRRAGVQHHAGAVGQGHFADLAGAAAMIRQHGLPIAGLAQSQRRPAPRPRPAPRRPGPAAPPGRGGPPGGADGRVPSRRLCMQPRFSSRLPAARLFLSAALLAGAATAQAQTPPAPGASPRIDALRKAGVLRVGVVNNPPWLVQNTTGSGEPWMGSSATKPRCPR